MGYHAPSAEEVYRYAFRLDGRRSLIDRFGFSIVLVNDNSAVCREFLQRYCLDLCLRTADRIRFVFFSEIPARQFQSIADAMNQGRLDPNSGMLRQVLGIVGEESRLDYEEEPWRSLRPASLRPLRDIEDIERQLSWECNTRTAMPGTGIAMTFAQRLGIGRHVPCIVVFTEIGELHVDLLPIARLSADEVFARVREWIDAFYEHNRARIDHWRTVEDEIQGLVNNASTTLQQIRRWRDERLAAWRKLTVVSRAIHNVEHGDANAWKELSDKVRRDYSSPFLLREVMAWVAEVLQSFDRRSAEVVALECATREVEGATYAERLQDVLTQLRETLPSNIRPQTLGDALHNLEERQNPRQELRGWWLRSGTLKLSFSTYKQARKAWASLSLARIIHEGAKPGHGNAENSRARHRPAVGGTHDSLSKARGTRTADLVGICRRFSVAAVAS